MRNKKQEISIVRSSAAEYLTFVASTGEQSDSMEMRYEDENIWLTQKMMAVLYDVNVRTINEHIKNIYADGELKESATIRKFRIVQVEGNRQVSREQNHYNLQMIIAVGFKVNNERAVQFRKWVEQAKLYAETEFEKYRIVQDQLYQSDFDRFFEEMEETAMLEERR